MRNSVFVGLAVSVTLALAGCGEKPPHPYPAAAETQFHASCPASDPVCVCTWDQITRAMTYEDYQAALDTFRSDGIMDPRLTRARTHCIEHHPS